MAQQSRPAPILIPAFITLIDAPGPAFQQRRAGRRFGHGLVGRLESLREDGEGDCRWRRRLNRHLHTPVDAHKQVPWRILPSEQHLNVRVQLDRAN